MHIQKRRGASLLSYGLIVGLISVVALVAVTSTGSSVEELFTETSDTLAGAIDTNAAQNASAAPSPTATPAVTATSCFSIMDTGGSTGDGVYQIDPDGPGGVSPFDVYCDMTKDGGGWTLAMTHVAPSSGNAWTGSTFSYGSPPLSPASGNGTALDPSLLSDLDVQHGLMLMVGNRILKLYYSDGSPSLENGYDRLVRRDNATSSSGHMTADAPHSGQGRDSGSGFNDGHTDSLCATANYANFLSNSECGSDASNSHPSWGNRPGNGTDAGNGSNCWFYGGSNITQLPNILSCPSGAQAPFATYTTTSNISGQIYQLWIR
ncbi:MAG: hypothetical protein Alpg2KO_21320 [Alphaproteobacteria bacterium]